MPHNKSPCASLHLSWNRYTKGYKIFFFFYGPKKLLNEFENMAKNSSKNPVSQHSSGYTTTT